MGYESRVYLVRKCNLHETIGEVEYKYGEIIASVNMCVCPVISRAFNRVSDCYIYVDNEQKIKDSYGDPLMEMNIQEAIEYIKKLPKAELKYRRYAPLLGLLEGFNESEWADGDLAVIEFGY